MLATAVSDFRTSQRVHVALLHVLAFVMLQLVYGYFITKIYESEGYSNHFNFMKFLLSLITIMILSMSVPKNRKLISFQLNITLAVAIMPMLVIYSGSDFPDFYALVAVFSYVITASASRVVFPRIAIMQVKPQDAMYILIALTTLFVLSFYYFGAFRTLNFDLNRVYELRREVASSLPGIYGYLIPLFSKSIIPIAIVLAASNRRYVYIAMLVGLSILLFGLTTHKGILFYPLVTIFVYYILSNFRAEKIFVGAIAGIILASAVDFILYESGLSLAWIGSMLTRRALLLPALHNYYYMEFFSQNPWYWWSHSKFSLGLIQMPFPHTAPFEIGLQYYGRVETSANTGWIGSGYSNAGIMGVALYAMFTGFLFSLIDTYSRKFGAAFVMGIFITQIVDVFTSADLTTLLLTHGLLASFLIISCIGTAQNHPQGWRSESV